MRDDKWELVASSRNRMFAHLDRLYEINKGMARPINIQIAPTDKCQLACDWCSVKNREGDELDIKEIQRIIDLFRLLGVKTVELTGGGDPTLHPQINKIINYAWTKKLSIGLITNGLALNKIKPENIAKLAWLRISLSAIDYDREDPLYRLDPRILNKTYLGCSYVFTKATTKARLVRVNSLAERLGANWIRVVADCYTPETIEWSYNNAPEQIKPYAKMFMQFKEYEVPSVCYWKYFKPFINSDGNVYHCSTCSLFEGRFPEHWIVRHWSRFGEIYSEPMKPFNPDKCSLCFFYRQNLLLQDIIEKKKDWDQITREAEAAKPVIHPIFF